MVVYEDKKWICRLIRTAFTIEDDTGICEKMFKDRPYTGTNEDSDPVSSDDSFDIREGVDIGHRRRSNTAVRLEKLERQRKTHSATQNIKVNPRDSGKNKLTFERDTSYLERQVTAGKSSADTFSVKKLIESVPHPDNVPFATYIRFDATTQPGIPSKNMEIFLTFLDRDKRAYPLSVSVVTNGKVRDLVGLILWLTSQKYPEVPLHPVEHYNLQIADEDSEWDSDFPPLDQLEPISKFSFSHLALVMCNKVQLANPTLGKLSLSFLLPNGTTFKLVPDDVDIIVGDLVKLILNKSGWSSKIIPKGCAEIGYHLEKLGDPRVKFTDSSVPLMQCKCKDFCLVRDGSKSVQNITTKVDYPPGDKKYYLRERKNTTLPYTRKATAMEVGRSDLYPVMVSTGRFNKLKNALCVIWSGDRMDLEFQHKTKSYPLSAIGGVKFDSTKNKIVLSLNQNPAASSGSHYLTTQLVTNHITFTTEELRIATELYQHLNLIFTSK